MARQYSDEFPRRRRLPTLAAVVGLAVWAAGARPAAPPDAVSLGAVLEANGCVDPGALTGRLPPAPPYAQGTYAQTPPGTWPDWQGHDIAGGDVSPLRTVSDPYPNFHGLALDVKNDRVVVSDSNRHGLLVYERGAATASGNAVATPVGWVRGPAAGMMFVSGVLVDPERREMYTVDNDIGDRLVTFPYDATGNVAPSRVLHVPHQAWGLALDTKRDEIAMTVESANMIAIFRRGAVGEEKPLRVIRGANTTMADPHGIAYDPAHDEYVVNNHGNRSAAPMAALNADAAMASPGFAQPSITVFPAGGHGNLAPVRVIQGDRTGLNWPMGLAIAGDDIAIGNHGDSSILIFSRTAQGNVAPVRRLKGAATGLDEPISVAFDEPHDELWVTNYNDHSALVFARTAAGNVPPLRTLRNGPPKSPVVGLGNAGAVAYDSKRQEILVPN